MRARGQEAGNEMLERTRHYGALWMHRKSEQLFPESLSRLSPLLEAAAAAASSLLSLLCTPRRCRELN